MLRRFFLIMLMVLWSSVSAARWDASQAALQNATQRMRQAQSSAQNCPPNNRCNHLQFLQKLETRDYQSSFMGLLKSRAPACQVAVDKTKYPQFVNRFSGAKDMANHFATKMFPEIGAVNHQRIAACAASEDASSRYKVAKFYNYMKRFNDGATRAVEELAAIDQVLGQSTLNCEGKGVIDQAYNRCQQIKRECKASGSQLAKIAADTAKDERVYQAVKEDYDNLQRRCLPLESDYKKNAKEVTQTNPSVTKCEKIFLDRVVREQCTTYTWEHKYRMELCKLAQEKLLLKKASLEDANPWFRSEEYFEDRETKGVEASIQAQLLRNRNELKSKFLSFRNAGLCVNGFQSAQSCDDKKIRNLLDETPEIEIRYDKGLKSNAGNLYLEAQSCIEEGVRDQNTTTRHIYTKGGQTILIGASLLATGGLSGIALGARAGMALQSMNVARIGVEVGVLAADVIYAGQSFKTAVNRCMDGPTRSVLVSARASDNQCPGPKSNLAQAQKEYTSCIGEIGLASLDAIPLGGNLALQTLKYVRGAKAADATSGAARVEPPKPSSEVVREAASTTARSERISSGAAVRAMKPAGRTARRTFVRDYAKRPITTVDENAEWVKLGSKVEPDGKTVFLDVQNSSMKRLNDSTSDKDLISALTNKNLEIVSQKVKGVLSEFPGVEAIPYSDFKSIRFAFRPKPPATTMPKDFDEKLKLAIEAGNKEFADFAKQSKLVSGSENPERWFSYGYGKTGDQANMASRYAKAQPGENTLQDFSNARVQASMTSSLNRAESLRTDLASELSNTSLWDSVDGRASMRAEVFELSRKASSAADLQTQISRSMGVEVSPLQAQRILDYSSTVDEFSPSINVVQRQYASLTDAVHGGISIDFKGVGGRNLKETAEAIANPKGLHQSVVDARLKEATVTGQLRSLEMQVREAVEEVTSANGLKVQVRVNGDDMVIIPDRPMTSAEKQQIAQAVTRKMDPSTIRMSSIPDGVPSAQRAELAVTGENIEKQLRTNLQGHIPKEKLDKVLFSVDMQAKKSEAVATLRTTSKNIDLTDAERKQIDEAFERAVAKHSPHATPDEMAKNAALSPDDKVKAFEDVNNLPRGYASSKPQLVDEVARIENQYPTPVSETPALRRPREEREALVAKRNELRRLGFTDQQIRRGMDQGIFGSPSSNNLVASYRQSIPVRLQDVNSAQISGSQYRPFDLATAVEKPMPRGALDSIKTPGTQAASTRYSEIVVDGETLGVFTKVLPRNKLRSAQGKTYRTEAEVAREAHMTKLLSDLGYGPKYIGSRALPNGDYEIATEFTQGVDFNVIGRGFEKKVHAISMDQIEKAERIALDMNDRGIYSRELQFMVSGDQVRVIDPEQFEFMDNAARLIGRRESILSEFKDLKEARRKWEAANTGAAKVEPSPVAAALVQRASEGANNSGIEVVQTTIGRVFAKVESSQSSFANEANYAQQLSAQGMGPRYRGTFTGSDGKKRLAYDYIEGTDVALNVERSIPGIEKLPDSIIPQMREINRKLVAQGINPVDIQYRVDKNGKVFVIDTEKFTSLPPGLQNTILKNLEENVDEIARIQQEAKQAANKPAEKPRPDD